MGEICGDEKLWALQGLNLGTRRNALADDVGANRIALARPKITFASCAEFKL